ncbi:hypothetical protein A2U01_0053980, partial [Trifolium medium]|nr:hypothetical protein [Trifolium medium]
FPSNWSDLPDSVEGSVNAETESSLKTMEAKVESLENELAVMRSSLTAVENAVRDMPAALMTMLEKSMGKSLQISEQCSESEGDWSFR